MTPRRRIAIVVAVAVLLVCIVAHVRVVMRGSDALGRATAAATARQLDDAIAGWEAAAREYSPFASHVDTAYAELITLGDNAQLPPGRRLAAWRAVRSAALATRSLWTPHANDLARANMAIAALASRDPDGAAAGGLNAEARRAYHAAKLAADTRPGTPALLGFVAVILGVLVGIGLLIRFTRRAARR